MYFVSDFENKASDAVDFSDITEMAEEEEDITKIQAAMSNMSQIQRSKNFELPCQNLWARNF